MATKKKATVMEEIKIISENDVVTVINNTMNTLFIRNDRTGQTWEIQGFGNIDRMRIIDIISIRATAPSIFNQGWLYIDDVNAVKYLGLERLYQYLIKPSELDNFFDKTEKEIEELLNNTTQHMKNIIIRRAKEKVKDGSLDSLKKQRLIESICQVKLDE